MSKAISVERPRVLVADPIADEGIAMLRDFATVDQQRGLSESQLTAIIGGYDAVVVRSETRITAGIIEAGARLHVIARAGVGVDNIDVEAASRKGVVVVNSPTGNIVAAAEHTIALLLALARHIPAASAALRAGRWERTQHVGTEIRGKTLGIVGLGKLGARVAGVARAFGMNVIAWSPNLTPEKCREVGVEYATKEELFRDADIITIHLQLSDRSRGTVRTKEFGLMKPTAYIVNTARGPIIEEEALIAALNERRIAGAGLDVFDVEPLPLDHPFRRMDNVVITPHLGYVSQQNYQRYFPDIVENIRAFVEGKPVRVIK